MKRGIIAAILLAVLLLGGCGRQEKGINSLADLHGQALTIGQSDDTDIRPYLLELCPEAKLVSQNDALYGVRSLAEGKLDAYSVGRAYLEKAIKEGNIKGVKILDEPVHTYECALGLSVLCQIPEFESTVNETMERLIADGTIEEMDDRWFVQKDEQMPEIALDDDPAYTLNAVTFGASKPYSFFQDGELIGFDVELVYRVCAMNHWGLKLTNAEYPAMLMGLSTGKYDMISANLYITDNRSENISFSTPFRFEEIAIAVRDTASQAAEEGEALEYSTLSDLSGEKEFAIMTGSINDTFVREQYPQAKIEYYPNVVDCSLALRKGKVDAAVYDAPVLQYIAACTEGVELMPELLTKDDFHFILPKSERGTKLQAEFNEWFAAQKQSGEVEKRYEFWCSDVDPDTEFDFDALPATNGKVKIATAIASRPDMFYFNNRPSGFTIELIYNFCRDMGYGAELSVISFDSMIPCITSGKADFMVTFVSYTEERAQSVLYTDCVKESGVGILVRTAKNAGGSSLLATMKNGIQKTFVEENRWRMIVSGLGVTILVTLGGFLLANLLGALLCACAMSRRKGLRILADVFDRIMQGTPMVVILMILFYVIFGKSSISGVWVAVFAFGMSSGTALARQFYGAIGGVDRGQMEAALALGFTKVDAFLKLVLPQAVRIALPGYFSELIGLMKGTAIIGYISVIDLTKASDLIRSSTYDAFFPLLSVALIYFLISFGLLSLLKRIQKKLAPKRFIRKETEA